MSIDGYYGKFRGLRYKDEILKILDLQGHGGLTAERLEQLVCDGMAFRGRRESLRALLKLLEEWGLVRHEGNGTCKVYYLLRPGEHGYMGASYDKLVDVSKMVR